MGLREATEGRERWPIGLGLIGVALVLLYVTPTSGSSCDPGTQLPLLVAALVLGGLAIRLPQEVVTLLPGALLPTWLACGAGEAAVFAFVGATAGGLVRGGLPLATVGAAGALAGVAGATGAVAGARALGWEIVAPPLDDPSGWPGVSAPATLITGALFMLGYRVAEYVAMRLLRLFPRLCPNSIAPRSSLVANILLLFPALVVTEMVVTRGSLLAATMLALLLAALVMIALYMRSETARDTAEGDQARLQSIVAFAPDGIFSTGADLRLESLNDTIMRLSGWSIDDAIGRPSGEVLDLRDEQGAPVDHEASFRQAFESGEAVVTPAILRGKDGRERTVVVSFSALPSEGGELDLGLGMVREVDRAQFGLQGIEGADLGHELRSPLTAILGYAQMLMTPPTGTLDAKHQAEFASRIVSSGDYMLRLVNNLLDLRRMESGAEQMQAEPIQLDVVLRTTFAMMMPRASEKEIALSLDIAPDLPPVVSDELLVRRILDNLISNAVKYTPAGGVVRVTATSEGAGIAISVADSGIGLTREEQARLFERFFRSGRPEARQERGTGLGLSLVREASRRLGGEVRVTSAVGVGSTFTFWLPVAPPEGRADRPATSLPARG